MSALRPVGEMDDLERVAVGIVEIGAAAGEDAVLALGYRRVVGVAVDHEGVMNDVGKPAAAHLAPKDHVVGARFEEYEMGIVLRRLRHEFEPENLGIEGAAAPEIADRNGHMQDALGPDHGRGLMAR